MCVVAIDTEIHTENNLQVAYSGSLVLRRFTKIVDKLKHKVKIIIKQVKNKTEKKSSWY